MFQLTDFLPLSAAFALKNVPVFPEAEVKLGEIEKSLNIYLHAFMRAGEQNVIAANKRRLSQTLSTQRHLNSLAWAAGGHAHLPESIQRFDDEALNRDLYYWLAAYIAFDQALPPPEGNQQPLSPALAHLLQGIMTSTRILKACPGLVERHRRLCAACLAERDALVPSINLHRNQAATMVEYGIRYALGDVNIDLPRWMHHAIDAAAVGIVLPNPPAPLQKPKIPFWPVALWGRPLQAEATNEVDLVQQLIDEGTLAPYLKDKEEETYLTEESEYAQMPELEDEKKADELTGIYVYPEWNCKSNSYRENWCQVNEELQDNADWAEPPAELYTLARQVRRQFEALRTDDRWLRRLTDGEEIDIDDFIETVCQRRGCGVTSERVFKHRKRDDREMAVMVLLDISNSTRVELENGYRVIDVERQAILVLAEALSELQDVFSIYAFSSHGREQVNCFRLKEFDEDYTDAVRERIFSVHPRGSTRIGAALRHMSKRFQHRTEQSRLLLLITDGRPFDTLDRYQGLYALEDSRKALQELNNEGIYTYGLTIDNTELDYLPRLYGPGRYSVFSHTAALPEFLPKLYARLTGLGN